MHFTKLIHMQYFRNKRVLITGGASGIGKIMGRMVLEYGSTLILLDINQEGLDQVVREYAGLGPVHGYRVDLSDSEQISLVAEQVISEHGGVDVLINNAGIVAGNGFFQEQSSDSIRLTMDVNTLAPMYVARAFLPGMIERNSGHLCTISSSASFISNPRMAVYAASKWAATGWSDSLRVEFRKQGLGIGVTTVTPFYIRTGMFDGVRSWIPLLDPHKVAGRILRGIVRNKAWVSMPWNMHLVRLAQGLLPVSVFDWFIGDVCGIYRTMDAFKGRPAASISPSSSSAASSGETPSSTAESSSDTSVSAPSGATTEAPSGATSPSSTQEV